MTTVDQANIDKGKQVSGALEALNEEAIIARRELLEEVQATRQEESKERAKKSTLSWVKEQFFRDEVNEILTPEEVLEVVRFERIERAERFKQIREKVTNAFPDLSEAALQKKVQEEMQELNNAYFLSQVQFLSPQIGQKSPFYTEVSALLVDIDTSKELVSYENFKKRFDDIVANPKHGITLSPEARGLLDSFTLSYFLQREKNKTEEYTQELVQMDEDEVGNGEIREERLRKVVEEHGSSWLKNLLTTDSKPEAAAEAEATYSGSLPPALVQMYGEDENAAKGVAQIIQGGNFNLDQAEMDPDGVVTFRRVEQVRNNPRMLNLQVEIRPTPEGPKLYYRDGNMKPEEGKRFATQAQLDQVLEVGRFNAILDQAGRSAEGGAMAVAVKDEELTRFVPFFKRSITDNTDPEIAFEKECIRLVKRARKEKKSLGQVFHEKFFSAEEGPDSSGIMNEDAILEAAQGEKKV